METGAGIWMGEAERMNNNATGIKSELKADITG